MDYEGRGQSRTGVEEGGISVNLLLYKKIKDLVHDMSY